MVKEFHKDTFLKIIPQSFYLVTIVCVGFGEYQGGGVWVELEGVAQGGVEHPQHMHCIYVHGTDRSINIIRTDLKLYSYCNRTHFTIAVGQ